jgi:tRNA A37 methylthiotransferase MiaB
VSSKPLPQIKEEFMCGLNNGYRSFTVLGDDPGCYGLDKDNSFPELLNLLIEEIKAFEKDASVKKTTLNISEIHPKFLIQYANEIKEIIKNHPGTIKNILCPVQSGNDRILGLMQREHSAAQIEMIIKDLKEIDQNINLSTHVIVGFPSEKREDLENTWALVKDCCFNSVVVFPYHDKNHTPASTLKGKLSSKDIKRREKETLNYFRGLGITALRKCPK